MIRRTCPRAAFLRGAIAHIRLHAVIVFLVLSFAAPTQALAQVAFQPPSCEFQAIFVVAPDVKEAVITGDDGKPLKSVIASLGVILDGKPNLFRAECTVAGVPTTLDQKLLLDDMKTIAEGNNFRNPLTWVEKSPSGVFVGRIRGQISDSTTTYVVDVHRFFGKKSIFDVTVGSPPGTFPSKGNLIFLKEIRLNGKQLH